MKHIKLLSLFTIILLFFSCSPEDSSDQSTEALDNSSNPQARISNTRLDEAKTLFKNMILTSEYQDYKIARAEFVYNLNGNFAQLRDKAEAMTWISNKIHLTRFPNVGEFERQLDNMAAKQGVLMSRNTVLYSYLEDADADQIYLIIKPSLGTPPPPVTNGGCADGCMDGCTNALNALDDLCSAMYASQTAFSIYSTALVDAYYWANFENILGGYNGCLSAC